MRRRTRILLAVCLLAASARAADATPAAGATDRAFELRLLARLASAISTERPIARWNYARFLLSRERAAEALGVLDTMVADNQALDASSPFRALRGRALLELQRPNEALAALSHLALANAPKACLWRMLAHDRQGRAAAVIAEWGCVLAQAQIFSPGELRQAHLALVRAYVGLGQLQQAGMLLVQLGPSLPEARYWRGVVALRQGQARDAEILFLPLTQATDPRLRLRATMGIIDARLQLGRITSTAALRELDDLRFHWRGGSIERDMIDRLMILSEARGDARATLAYGATLFRYFDFGADTPRLLARLRPVILACLDHSSPLPLAVRAGLLWDYRDLLPLGAEGDDVLRSLADQLAGAGLYRRAADLLAYQVENRLPPGAGSSLGLQAAEWRMIAGQPEQALHVLDATRSRVIDPQTATKRDSVAAFAFLATGRGEEAYALLSGREGQLPMEVQAELFWQAKDWRRFLVANTRQLPVRGAAVALADRTLIIRHAIAAASVADGRILAELDASYGATMAVGPLSTAFAVLVRPEAPIEPQLFNKALADLASAVPPPRLDAWLMAFTGGLAANAKAPG